MISIDITEKLWDAVRPGSVKKTGLSDAVRTATKVLSKSLDTPKAYADADEAIVTLKKAIDETAVVVKKASDDKKGAAGKLKGWSEQCELARKSLATQRKQAGLLKAVNQCDAKLQESLAQVRKALVDAKALAKDIESGKLTDTRAAAVGLQKIRDAMRDGLKVAQKDGFAAFIRTFDSVMDWGLDPLQVPMSPVAKTIKAELPELERAAEQARIAAEKLVAEAGKNRAGAAADAVEPLVKAYQQVAKNLKAFAAPAKKLNADAHAAADKFKDLIAKGIGHEKLIPVAQQMHDKAMAAELQILKECSRGRAASGDVMKLRVSLRNQLEGEVRKQFEVIASEEWNLIMVTFRETSEQMAEVHRQVQRVVRLIGESSAEAKLVTDTLYKSFEREVIDQRNKYAS